MKTYIILLCSVLSEIWCSAKVQATNNGYGDQVINYPHWEELSILVLTNTCRMDPIGFRNKYIGSSYNILETYPAVPPLYWNIDLNKAARFHADELATVPGCSFSHNSCDGTPFSQRVKSYYTKSSSIAENIAAGYSDPLNTLRQWIRDDVNGEPAPDKSGNDGHRRNIMNGVYKELGCGYAPGTNKYGYYWVQDFGGANSAFTTPITGGSHFFIKQNVTTFMLNFYATQGKNPQEAVLNLAGKSNPLTLDLGGQSKGTYVVEVSRGSDCRNYYFSVKDGNNKVWRFPEKDYLVTKGEGDCTEEFRDSSITSVEEGYFNRPHRISTMTGLAITAQLNAGRILIRVNLPQYITLSLYNHNGDIVTTWAPKTYSAGTHELPLVVNWTPGLYLLKISDNESVAVLKLLKIN